MKISKAFHDCRNGLIESRKLKIFKLEKINFKKMNQISQLLLQSHNLKNDPEGKQILEDFGKMISKRNHQGFKLTPQISEKESENLPIEISQLGFHRDGVISGVVWVVEITGRKPDSSKLRRHFNSLIIHLKLLHLQLMKNETFEELRSKETLHIKYLFQWLYDVLMNQNLEGQNFPLFGNFKLQGREKFDVKPLDCSEFSEPQIVLMDHFSNLNSSPSMIQLAVYLFGYWCKKQEKSTFTKIFPCDHTYWATAYELIRGEI
jgi:hypothetical protein